MNSLMFPTKEVGKDWNRKPLHSSEWLMPQRVMQTPSLLRKSALESAQACPLPWPPPQDGDSAHSPAGASVRPAQFPKSFWRDPTIRRCSVSIKETISCWKFGDPYVLVTSLGDSHCHSRGSAGSCRARTCLTCPIRHFSNLFVHAPACVCVCVVLLPHRK